MVLSQNPYVFGLVLVLAAFVPPIGYLVWVRNMERYAPEPWRRLAKAFAWGAFGGTTLALILEVVIGGPPHALTQLGISSLVFTAVLVAPVVEEATKAYGLRWIDDEHLEPEDGLIYGAAVGFGFAATENLIYEVSAYLDSGVAGLIQTAVLRTLSTAFLHGVATGVIGYAIWRRRAGAAGTRHVAGAYLVAVAIHMAFNLGASLQLAITFLASLAIAFTGLWWLRDKIRTLDRRPGQARTVGREG